MKFVAIIIITATIAACSVDNGVQECTYNQVNPITAVAGPDTVAVDEEITFEVTIKMSNECGELQRFTETNGFPKNISALVIYNDCQCGSTTVSVTEPYTFTASATGTYELKFMTANAGTPIIKTITVTE